MLCVSQWGIFLFFAGWVFLMSLFIILFTPETKGIPLVSPPLLWLLQHSCLVCRL